MTQPATKPKNKVGAEPVPAVAPKTKVTVTAPATAAKNKAPRPAAPKAAGK